jgi:hypothetical protein
MSSFRNGQVLFRFGDGYRIVDVCVERRYTLESLMTGERSVHNVSDLLHEAAAGALSSSACTHRQLLASVLLGIPHSPVAVPSTRAWTEAARRLDYIQKLVTSGSFDLPWPWLWAAVARIGRERGDAAIPHPSTVRRWRAKHVEAGKFTRALLGRHQLGARATAPARLYVTGKPDLRVVR